MIIISEKKHISTIISSINKVYNKAKINGKLSIKDIYYLHVIYKLLTNDLFDLTLDENNLLVTTYNKLSYLSKDICPPIILKTYQTNLVNYNIECWDTYVKNRFPNISFLDRVDDVFKTKLLAANVDQVVIMVATEPSFSEDLLGRALVAAEAQALKPLILLNKIDLPTHLDTARARLNLYQTLNYPVIEISVHQTEQTLQNSQKEKFANIKIQYYGNNKRS